MQNPLRTAGGKPLRMVGRHADNTHRKQAEEALRQSEEKYRLLVNQIPAVVFKGYADWSVDFFDNKIEALTGYSKEEFDSRQIKWCELILPEEFEQAKGKFINGIKTGGAYEREYRIRKKDGGIAWIQAMGQIFFDAAGKLDYISGVIFDITDRKRAEDALKESEERYRRLTGAVTDYIYTVTVEDGRAIHSEHSAPCVAVTGYTSEEFAADPYLWFCMVVEEDRELVRQHAARLLAGEDPGPIEHRLRRKDGMVRWVSNMPVLHWDSSGQLISYDGLISDITARKLAETALQESEERYRMVADFTYNMEYWLGPDQSVIYMSPSCERLTGYKREEFFRDPILLEKIVHPADRSLFAGHSKEAPACPHPMDVDFRLVRRDGREIWISHACQPVYGLDGRPLGRRVSNRDITECKRAEKELREITRFNQEIIDGAGEGIIVHDRQFRYKLWNKFMEEMTGIQAEEVLNRDAFEVFPHLKERRIKELLQWALEGETVTSTDVPFFIPKTGRKGWVVGTYAPHRNINGDIIGVIATLQDVTQRKQVEEALQAGTRLNRLLLDSLPCVALLLRPYTREIVASNAAAALVGAVPGKQCYATFGQRQDPCPFCLAPEVWETGQDQHLEIEYGGVYWDAHWVPIKEDLYLHYAFDITARKEAENAQKKVEAQLFQAQKMEALGTLAGGIAHDFNNILGAMMGFAELASFELPENSTGRLYLHDVLKAGERARHLVKQILSFSRQEKGARQPLALTPIIKETLRFLKASLPATIQIRSHLYAKKALTFVDPIQIHQVLLNLATNAAHAMEEKGGVLEVSLEEVELTPEEAAPNEGVQSGPYLELRVRDTGHGMESAVLERIFDPFFTTKGAGKGTGMGLAVVYGIVKDHEGIIRVRSQPGQGTTFQILLPTVEGRPAEEKSEFLTPLSKGRGRILFVDDDKDFFPAGQRMLAALGYEVVAHAKSLRALEEFQTQPHHFDLIICNQTMPGLTGLELAAACLRLRPDIPFILCTGFSEIINPEKIRAAGIGEVITKPFNLHRIGEIIKKVLKKNKKEIE